MKLLHADITSRTLGLTLGLALGTLTAPSLAAPVGQCSDPVRIRYNTEFS